MQQEINLYVLLPHEKKSFLSIKMLTLSYSIFMIILMLNFCFSLWVKHKQMVRADEITKELQGLEQRLAEVNTQYPMIDWSDAENSIVKLKHEIKEENKVLRLLSKDRSFSNYLTGIAKAAVPDMWLVNIQMNLKEEHIVLNGYASQSAAVQNFINNLVIQKEFSDMHFQLQQLSKAELNTETVFNFIISTEENELS